MALYKCSITLHCITITKNYLVHRINTHRQSDASHLTISPRSFTYRAITENTALPQIIAWFNEPRKLSVERHLQYHILKSEDCILQACSIRSIKINVHNKSSCSFNLVRKIK